ncbi:putative toxin-antitoxin system toxin component, PIN family [bacterium]|nr:putative toxin-antitoxin system toxin component, PIN family [bacterium]
MKVILDANVLISYLLASDDTRTVVRVVEACFAESIPLLVPPELLNELTSTVRNSTYLQQRIYPSEVTNLSNAMSAIGITPPPIDTPLQTSEPTSRDRNDDYLIAQALLHNVGYIVTGDKDLLVLGQVQHVHILSPSQFWATLANT